MQRMHRKSFLEKALLTTVITLSVTACSTTTPKKTELIIDQAWQPVAHSQHTQNMAQLLEAEFSLQRLGSDVAAPLYLAAARTLQDPEVAKRATSTAMINNNTSDVLAATQRWLELDPKAEHAYPVRLQALLQSNQQSDAKELLHQAIENDVSLQFLPDFVDQNVRDTDLTKALANIIQDKTLTTNIYVENAQTHIDFLNGRYTPLTQTIDRLIQRTPKSEQEALFVIKAVSLDQIGRGDEAIEALQKSLETFPDSDRILSNYLELLVKHDRVQQALSIFEDTQLPPHAKQQLGMIIGQQLLHKKQYQQSIEVLSTLPRQGGLSEQVLFLLANAERGNGDFEAAIQNLANVFGQLSWNASELLVQWLYETHQSSRINAIILKRAAAEQEPGHIIGVTDLHIAKGRLDLAFDLVNHALATFPALDSVRYKRAIMLDGQDQWSAAIKDLTILAQKHPEDASYINALGYTMMVRTPEHLDQAFKLVQKAYTLDSEDPAIIDSMGWAFYLRGDLDKAQTLLSKAWQQLEDAEIGAHYGEVLWQQDNQQQAVDIWRRSLELNDSLPTLVETIENYAPQLFD